MLQPHLLCLCKHIFLHLLRHDVLWKRLQFAGQKLDGPLPHDVLPLQDLRKEASQSAWMSTNRRGTSRITPQLSGDNKNDPVQEAAH